ncbi:alpha/beta fold hydrolase [Fusobacterium perfoetens]|uniref:alpha/beta fold hydrolase n=1 Tax=Fusobacterium perfoetens TaxID=852 RepID=UPI000483F1E2|nr:alpha/beta hydrolase [Fusobacterium perfoetens]
MLKTKTIVLDNKESIVYREYGTGNEILIFIHGNICSGIFFEPFLNYFNKNKYRILIPDLRGFGESSYLTKINSISDFSDDLNDFFSKLNINNFTLLGWSAGGPICMNYSSSYPMKVKSLILINSVGVNGYPMYDENGKKYISVEEISQEKSQVLPVLNAIKNQDKLFIKNLWNNAIYIYKKPNCQQSEIEVSASLKQRNLPEVYLALSNFNMTSILFPNIPSLIIFGDSDSIIKKEDIFLTAKYLNTNNIIKILNCGHSPFIDSPNELFKYIDNFIKNFK